ncbi:MAG: poly-gamma-glutamate biosynthesis protein PgsC [Candidatus Aminicenantes bacterium]|nr:poly-gamma-glutamate biosynthesis protein PgsC [Candidatus Aminicenantes bacterium]HHF51093.1 poly-gamma-glutamate biosynthesis protein PgsC [Candidatus Aminicenantes bacterium]
MTYETIFLGLLLATLYVEIFDIYPGGIIVPAYMALYLHQPGRIAATVVVAYLSLFSYKLLSRYVILFGRRRFVLVILMGALWAHIWFLIWPEILPQPIGLRTIGLVIPGLLANNMEKQKHILTIASMITVAVATYFLARVVGWIGL